MERALAPPDFLQIHKHFKHWDQQMLWGSTALEGDRAISRHSKQASDKGYGQLRDEIFESPYNQAVIDHIYRKKIEGRLWCRLCLYVFYLILMSVFGIWYTFRNDRGAHFLYRGLCETVINDEYDYNISQLERSFPGIDSVDEFYMWAKGPFAQSFYGDSIAWYPKEQTTTSTRGFIFNQNRIIGVPRWRQVRSKAMNCSLHRYFKDVPTNSCLTQAASRHFIPMFSTMESRNDKFETSQWSQEPFGGANGSEYRYHSQDELEGIEYWGRMGWYEGGGYIIDFPDPRNKDVDDDDIGKMVEKLEKENWIDARTRAVFVEFSVYNLNERFFMVGVIMLEFPLSGGVVPNWDFNLARLSNAQGEFVWVEYVKYVLFVGAMLEIIYHLTMLGELRCSYFRCIGYRPFAIISFVFLFLVFYYWYYTWKYQELLRPSFEHGLGPTDDKYVPMLRIAQTFRWGLYFYALWVMVHWVRLFEHLTVFKNVTLLIIIIEFVITDLRFFLMLLVGCWTAFTATQAMTYGYREDDSYTLLMGLFTSIMETPGGIDVDDAQAPNVVMGSIYSVIFVSFIALLLLNLSIAILSSAYENAKEASGSAYWARRQYRDILAEAKWDKSTRSCVRLCCGNPSYDGKKYEKNFAGAGGAGEDSCWRKRCTPNEKTRAMLDQWGHDLMVWLFPASDFGSPVPANVYVTTDGSSDSDLWPEPKPEHAKDVVPLIRLLLSILTLAVIASLIWVLLGRSWLENNDKSPARIVLAVVASLSLLLALLALYHYWGGMSGPTLRQRVSSFCAYCYRNREYRELRRDDHEACERLTDDSHSSDQEQESQGFYENIPGGGFAVTAGRIPLDRSPLDRSPLDRSNTVFHLAGGTSQRNLQATATAAALDRRDSLGEVYPTKVVGSGPVTIGSGTACWPSTQAIWLKSETGTTDMPPYSLESE
eukprot:g19147.t1